MTTEAATVLLETFRKHLDNPICTVDDNFYSAGGDSLIALRVVAEAVQRGVGIELQDILYFPTVRELVDALNDADRPAPGTPAVSAFALLDPWDRELVPAGVVDAGPAPALAMGLLYLCELSDDPGLHQDLVGFEVRGRFHEPTLRESLAWLCARHEALRSFFDLTTLSVAARMVCAEVEFPVEVVRLDTDDRAKADTLVERWRADQLRRPMDWGQAPLGRCHIVAQPGSFRFSLVVHHSIADGWSLARLVVELLTHYDATLAGRPADLGAPPVEGLRTFVWQERAAIDAPEAAAYWLERATVPPLVLASDRFGQVPDQRAEVGFTIAPALLAGLRESALAAQTPLKSLVLAAHLRALGEWAGRTDNVVTGLVTNGRPEIDGADLLVGLFLNTVPTRLDSLTGTWAELAARTLRAEQEGTPYRRFPLSEIERRLGHPAFDVAFNFTHFHAYAELAQLTEIEVGSWWTTDKNSLPMMVDFAIDSPGPNTSVSVSFDPALISTVEVERYADLYLATLRTAVDPHGKATP